MVEILDPSLMVWTVSLSVENWRRRVSSGSRIWQLVGTRVGENRDVMQPVGRDFHSEFDGVDRSSVGREVRAQGQVRF